jgi:hypothetical protein
VVEAAGVVVGVEVAAAVDPVEAEPDGEDAVVVELVDVVVEPVVPVVVVVDVWWVDAPATATPIPAAATVAVSPIATVARRMRTRAASRERTASFAWR